MTLSDEAGQTIRGWGFGISLEDEGLEPLVSGEMSAEARRRALELLVDDAGTNIVRIFSPGFGSGSVIEPENDNPDPLSLDIGAFELEVTGRLELMEELYPRGVRFLLTGGAAPSWMKDGRTLRRDMAPEFAEYLTAYAVFARRSVGADFDWITVANEPDNDAMRLLVDAETSADVLSTLSELLSRNGLPARLVVGDTVGWSSADAFLEAALAKGSPLLAAVAAHSYQSLDARPRVAERARRAGLEVWMTEQSGAGGKDCLGDDPGMSSALQWARWIIEDLVDGRVSVWLALRGVASLCHDPQGGLLVYDTTEDRLIVPKRYFAFRQFALAGPPGSTRLIMEKGGGHDLIPAVAFDRGDDVAVVVLNGDDTPRSVEVVVPWVRSTVTELRITSESLDGEAVTPPPMRDGGVRLVVPPEAVMTLVVGKPSS